MLAGYLNVRGRPDRPCPSPIGRPIVVDDHVASNLINPGHHPSRVLQTIDPLMHPQTNLLQDVVYLDLIRDTLGDERS